MTKSRIYTTRFLSALLLICGLHLLLGGLGVLSLPEKRVILIDVILLLIFGGGMLIIAPGLNRTAENFVGRFLILTTVQMLSALSVIAAIVYKKVEMARPMGFHLIVVFLVLLTIQSVLLIRLANRN